MNWKGISLTGDPLLVIMLRDDRGALFGVRVDVDRKAHAALKKVGDDTLHRLQSWNPAHYTPYVEREEGTYLTIDPTALEPKDRPKRRKRDTPDPGTSLEAANTAALVGLVENADYLESMGAGALLELPEQEFYAQGIALRDGNKRIGFVTKTNPRKVFRRAALAFIRSKDNERFEKLAEPELALEENVDVVVHPDEIAVLDERQFRLLTSDTKLLSKHMPGRIKHIAGTFASLGIPLASDTESALIEKAQTSPQFARRMDALDARLAGIDKSLVTGGKGFRESDLDPSDFVDKQGEITCDRDRVGDLLDALEGRLYGDPFSAERRRAQRFKTL